MPVIPSTELYALGSSEYAMVPHMGCRAILDDISGARDEPLVGFVDSSSFARVILPMSTKYRYVKTVT